MTAITVLSVEHIGAHWDFFRVWLHVLRNTVNYFVEFCLHMVGRNRWTNSQHRCHRRRQETFCDDSRKVNGINETPTCEAFFFMFQKALAKNRQENKTYHISMQNDNQSMLLTLVQAGPDDKNPAQLVLQATRNGGG